mmetsp:Transcript_111187/g.270184  ORF Transcript_111187/g.270184 Transcript_111187/m.270184 type:complete len:264 (+) Transcript_111187:958-1749(+)
MSFTSPATESKPMYFFHTSLMVTLRPHPSTAELSRKLAMTVGTCASGRGQPSPPVRSRYCFQANTGHSTSPWFAAPSSRLRLRKLDSPSTSILLASSQTFQMCCWQASSNWKVSSQTSSPCCLAPLRRRLTSDMSMSETPQTRCTSVFGVSAEVGNSVPEIVQRRWNGWSAGRNSSLEDSGWIPEAKMPAGMSSSRKKTRIGMAKRLMKPAKGPEIPLSSIRFCGVCSGPIAQIRAVEVSIFKLQGKSSWHRWQHSRQGRFSK